MRLRSVLGSLQLPVAVFGFVVVGFALVGAWSVPPSPPDSEGFVEGLAYIVLYAIGICGFVTGSLGLAIPPGDGYGVQFNRWQRWLFVAAAATAVGSIAVPLFGFGLSIGATTSLSLFLSAWFGLSVVAVCALLGGLGWRTAEVLAPQVRERV
jgi:hypothetical protein